MSLMRRATDGKTIIVGDFNLNYTQKENVDYRYANMFSDFDEKFQDINLVQMINFPTWSRIVNNVLKESTLDHIYLTDPTICMNIDSHKPCFGDHLLITITINLEKVKNVNLYKRDWRNYSKENLICLLNNVEWCTDFDNVQILKLN